MRRIVLFLLFVTSCFAQQGGPPIGTQASSSNLAVKPATSDSVFYVSVNGNDSNDGRSWGSAKLTLNAAIALLSVNGGTINVGCGTFTYATAPSLPKNSILMGSGIDCTILSPTGNSDGIDINANNVAVEHLTILGPGSGTGVGINIGSVSAAGASRVNHVKISAMGSHGYYVNGTTLDVTQWHADDVSIWNSGGDGFRFTGPGAEEGVCIQCVTHTSTGWGKNLIGSSNNNLFLGDYDSLNMAGGHQVASGSNIFIAPITEAGTGATFIFTATAVGNQVFFPLSGQPTTYTDSGVANQRSYEDVGLSLLEWDNLSSNHLNFWPGAGATRATQYMEESSGRYVDGWLSLRDVTDSNRPIWGYDPVNNAFKFLTEMDIGDPLAGYHPIMKIFNAATNSVTITPQTTMANNTQTLPIVTGTFQSSATGSGLVCNSTVSGADYTNTTTTPSTIFSCTLPATASAVSYRYSCDITWESTAATLVGLVLGVNLSAAPTQLTSAAIIQNTLAGADTIGYISNTTTGHQNVLSGGAAGVTSTNYWAKIYGTIEGAAAAGSTFIIDGAATSGTTANLVVRRGSGCTLN